MRGLVFFGGAGAVNSLRKQHYEETRVTALELTDRGFNNIQKSFIAFLAGVGMSYSGFFMMCTPALPLSFPMILAGSGARFYGCFKGGEGMMDLLQSPPRLDNFSKPTL